MIIWINGAFGVGKTSTAIKLNEEIKNSFIYDPEHIGEFIQENIPNELRKSDFQDYEMWRTLNKEYIKYLYRNYKGILIIPMTIINNKYFEEIISDLESEEVEIREFILMASKKTIVKRLKHRGEKENSWAENQIDRCLNGLDNRENKSYIDTENKTVKEIAKIIMGTII